jgi:aminopeptidase N
LLVGPGAWLHEWMHNWYHGLLGTNESLYGWMDEGFTSYAEDRVTAFLENNTGFTYEGAYRGYVGLAKSGKEEPLTTHADHYNLNAAYGPAVYSKGEVFMEQLGYIVGAPVRDKILLEYYKQWRFKHPNANDFLRIAEKLSDMKLDWYKEYWINTTRTIDYSIDSLWEEGGMTKVRIRRKDLMPMPIDMLLTFKDGTKEMHYIPMNLMYGEKPNEDADIPRKVYEPWKWTDETYTIETTKRLGEFTSAEIDPSLRMADIDRKNNRLEPKW